MLVEFRQRMPRRTVKFVSSRGGKCEL